MRVFEYNDTSVSLVHTDYEEGDSEHYLLSKKGFAHSAGQLLLLSEIPTEDVLAIAEGDPAIFAKYILPDFRQRNRYLHVGGSLALYDAPYSAPIVRHDYILELP